MIGKLNKPEFISDIKGFINRNYLKNRTIVSSDIELIFNDIEKTTGMDIIRHRYRTGEEHGTWEVPPKWDIKTAWLKDSSGKIIASYHDHPLFVSPYSCPVDITISYEELLKHIVTSPEQPNAFAFNWRYASDARLRLKDWGLSIPHETLTKLNDKNYKVFIDVDIKDGDMLVGEIIIKGKSPKSIMFVANYCHPGQVNDSFSGLAMFMKVMMELSKCKQLKYTYRFIFCQETIGSAIYIASNPNNIKDVQGAIFSEMVGWGKNWYLKNSRTADTYMDLLANECVRYFPDLANSDFFSLIGNDEYILNSVQVGIPTLSLQKYPFDEYHTSNDKPSNICDEDLFKAVEIILHIVNINENNKIYKFVDPVPFWMTRFDLYSDDIYEPEEFKKKLMIVYEHLDGNNSILEIAEKLEVTFKYVFDYCEKMKANNLIKEINNV